MNRKADKSPFDKAQEVILGKLRAWHRAGKKLSTRRLRDEAVSLSTGCKQHFGSCREAIKAAGLPYEGHQGRQFWNAKTTSERLKQLHRRGADLSWTGLGRLDYSLAQATVRYFGQYATALQAAGIDYEKYRRRTTVTWD